MKINQEKLKKLNDLLTILRENESVSPYFLARQASIPVNTIIKILNSMVSRSMFEINFVLRCINDDTDLVHTFEFAEEDDLLDFLRENDKCPDCGAKLLTKDIRVFYKMSSEIVGDLHEH